MIQKSSIRLSLLHAFLVFIGLIIAFNIWVQHAFQGNYWGPFLPGANFGIPALEKAMGFYTTSPYGYDAQFYYYQSNDLLGTNPDTIKHIDLPSYRYQRFGVPLAARAASAVFGYSYTSPLVYNLVQFFWVALGFYFLIRWLSKHNLSQIYAYGWLLSIGVIGALARAMPDPVGDAFFIMAVIFAIERRIFLYCLVTCYLLLVREGYAAFAAVVFLLTILGVQRWEKVNRWIGVGLTMLPGIICVTWIGYITLHFGKSPIAATRGQELTDWPFFAAIKTFITALKTHDAMEIKGKILGLLTLLIGLYVAWKNKKEAPVWYAVLVYIFLICCLGVTVWVNYLGYFKALGSVYVVIILGLSYCHERIKLWIKVFLILVAIWGLHANYQEKRQAFFDTWNYSTQISQILSDNTPKPLTTFSSEITGINIPSVIAKNQEKSLFDRFYRRAITLKVMVKNTSNETWAYFSGVSPYMIKVSYKWLNLKGKDLLIDSIRTPIDKSIKPGEENEINIRVIVPPPGKYLLKIEMMQEGVAWFADKNGGEYKKFILVK